jgi:sugar lactone lactonase YvrE
MSQIFDDTACELGEGPLWHPGRGQLYWFDIMGRRLLTREGDRTCSWDFGEHVSAAGWVSETELLVASETRLLVMDLESDRREDVIPLEADDARTRSNDGRADPWGGFWIGTMGKGAELGLGSIYRFHRSELRRLFHPITISNAICFAPDRTYAYFADTQTKVIRRTALDEDGWPDGEPEDWLDLRDAPGSPDGAVTDSEGNLWNAQWGGWRVACYAPDGSFLRAVEFDAAHTSCPAFGGADMSTLYCTSAFQGRPRGSEGHAGDGKTYMAEDIALGLPEPRVIL